MISKYINLIIIAAMSVYLSACTSSSGSSSAGTQVTISVAPSPANVAAMPAGAKTFTVNGNEIILTKAYLVISSATIETDCSAMSFRAALDGMLDIVVPVANAHTTSTPTSTGEPYVINILGVDGGLNNIGALSPPAADYCGVDVDISAADADASNLPDAGAGEPDMIGKTLFIEGTYTPAGGLTGNILMSTGTTLINRNLLLSALMMISPNNLNGSVKIAINYDTWFDAVDLNILENEVAAPTDSSSEGYKVLQNITNSIHQL
ncbi:MAG: hypothetical protein DRQ44_09000 [Gammaproteobacteria bacterium]|nr:MAG: hypothetical protein DRQ44_09000 [Gammaproteobacteria bacterium]